VWLVNSNQVKDQASNRLGRTDPGGQIHFPIWYDEAGDPIDVDWLYTQLTTEIRTPRGWVNQARRKNEAFDLLSYCIAICKHPDIRLLQIDWSNPPAWASPDWDVNELVFGAEGRPAAPPETPAPSIADLAKALG